MEISNSEMPAYVSPEMDITLFDTVDFLFKSGEPGNTNEDMDWLS